jgi:hypothetical protein
MGWAVAGVLSALALALPASGAQPALKPLDWPNDTRLQFGIYNNANERYATAYYRILKEEVNGKQLYHFKYLGRNAAMSEAAEVWVDPADLVPVRSTRKVVSGKRILYVDCGYEPTRITVRHKYEGQRVTELSVPTSQAFYDFEELMWLVPQIVWDSGSKSTYLNYFNSFKFQLETTIVNREGLDSVALKDHTFLAQKYRFDVGSTKYTYWTVDQNGREVPAKVLMDDPDDRRDITFVNLGLDPKKVKVSQQQPAAAVAPLVPPTAPAQPPASPPAAPPAAPVNPGEENPLVPARPGGHG